MINALRGEFEASLDGRPYGFDTKLGTIAAIEGRCGDAGIVEILNTAVFGRQTKDRIALLAAALSATGVADPEAERLAAAASMSEAEAFILALMGALGFDIAARRDEEARPLDGASDGGGGGSSPSAA